jgi:predicted ATPase
MLKRLHLQNFTVFADANFDFGPGLNVLVGNNGTGKSHVLKVGYVAEDARFNVGKEFTYGHSTTQLINSTVWTTVFRKSLLEVFRLKQVASLMRWKAETDSEIKIDFSDEEQLLVSLISATEEENGRTASITVSAASAPVNNLLRPVFIPAKEILTLSWILPASEQLVAPIEKNYLDILNQLRLLPLRKSESTLTIQSLTDILGGEVQEQGDEYYLVDTTGRQIAIGMVAEGLRKFGTLQKLIANGSLTKNSTLYWDEPEANLNPQLLCELAKVLAELARQGFQIILATHSMSLLKEFHILSREPNKKKLPIKYFGLNARPGEATTVVTTDDFKYLPDVVALEVELEQADELEDIFAKEATQFHADNH